MKRALVFVIFVFCFGTTSVFAAETVTNLEYENFSVALPKNWTADKGDDGKYVAFSNADASEALVVMVLRPFSGMTSKEFADSVRASTKGYDFKSADEGFYMFKSMDGDIECRSIVGVYDDAAILITVAGSGPELMALAASVRIKIPYRPKTEVLF